MQQLSPPEDQYQPQDQCDLRVAGGDAYHNDLENARSTTYSGIQLDGNTQAQFGDQLQRNYGVTINATNVNINDQILHQLSNLDLNSSLTHKTFGLCLGHAPQIEQDAFIGRSTELQQLEEWFLPDYQAQKVVSIVGMGGLGKTQLSLAYARNNSHRYTSVFWVNAKDELSLRQGLGTIASMVVADTPNSVTVADKEQVRVELVRRWLSERWNNRWLIIFDNYDDPNLPNLRSDSGFDIRSYFPHQAQGHILITTRTPKLTFSKRLTLKRFDCIESSLAILSQRAGQDLTEDPDARKLAIRLDGLPLALATAGVYLNQTNVSCTEYLQAYESAWMDLYGPDAEELLEYEDRTLSSTWVVSFDQVRKMDADAAEMFKFWAYFSNKDIWYELLQAGAKKGPAWMSRVTNSKIRFGRAMARLQDYSLVEITSGSYNIHPCVHTWISTYFETELTSFLAAVSCVAENIPEEASALYRSTTRRLLLHITRLNDREFDRFWEKCALDVGILDYFNDSAAVLYRWDRIDHAEKLFLRAMAGYEARLGHDHPSTLRIVGNLGLLYAHKYRLDKAETMYVRALSGYEKAKDTDNVAALNTLHNLGSLYRYQGKLVQAEEKYLQVLARREVLLGTKHPSTLQTASNLGSLYWKQGKLEAAEQMLLRALDGNEKVLGYDHMMSLYTIQTLGSLYNAQGKLEQAEKLYLRALAGVEALGTERTLMLTTLESLGCLYHDQGKPTKAEETFRRILSVNEGKDMAQLRRSTIARMSKLFWKNIREMTTIGNIEGARHELTYLIRLTKHPDHTSRLSSLYKIARALLKFRDEENMIVAFVNTMGGTACDACDANIDLTTGLHVCCSCEDVDLCNQCKVKFNGGYLNSPSCEGHEFFDVGIAVLESSGPIERLDGTDLNAWLEKLRSKYPVVDTSGA